ncbi:hypothetical protein Hanom_Chr03g00225451 [Helianthus anomalus]
MSVLNHNHVTPLSSSSSAIFAKNTFTSVRTQIVSVSSKKAGVCKCVATSPAEQTGIYTFCFELLQ